MTRSNFDQLREDLGQPFVERRARFVHPDDVEQEIEHTGAHQESLFKVAFLDAQGLEQFCQVRCTIRPEQIKRPQLLRQAIEVFFRTMGAELLSVQMSRESSYLIEGVRSRPRLVVIPGGDPDIRL